MISAISFSHFIYICEIIKIYSNGLKHIIKTIIFILLINFPLLSQELFVCKSYTEDGEPIDASVEWKIDPSGTNVFVLYKHGGSNFKGSNLFLFFDKKFRGIYNPFDSKILSMENNKKWIVFDYLFREEGEYEIYVMDLSQTKLAEIRIKVKFDYAFQKEEITSRYYDSNNLVFCERVINGKPINPKRSISLNEKDGELYIYFKSKAPLNTEILKVNVWRKKNRLDYDEFIEKKKYKVDPNWNDSFFKYKFAEPGNYKVSIYNENDLLINNGYILVYE